MATLKQQLLSKLNNAQGTELPRCKECGKRMKQNSGGGFKCPHCGSEMDMKAEKSVESDLKLYFSPARMGVTQAFKVMKGLDIVGYLEQRGTKWAALAPNGVPLANGKLSKEGALEELKKHPGHDQKSHGNWAANPDTRQAMLDRKGKTSGRGRKSVEVKAQGTFKPKNLKMRPSILKKISAGWKSKFDSVSFSREDLAGQTPYVSVKDKRFPKGSVAERINQMIGTQVGRADAYYRHAMSLDPKTQNTARQSLLYKAEKFIEFSNKILGPALKREQIKLGEK